MPNVLLFREPSGGQDRYEQLFQESNYSSTSVPVLETVHSNLDSLGTSLLKDYDGYSGIIITSKRSCDALHESLLLSLDDDDHGERGHHSEALGR